MCGSGTLLIEAAMIALNIAPDFIESGSGLWGGSGIGRSVASYFGGG
jgi:23S rRNA G2445 N2-methylase RlmL